MPINTLEYAKLYQTQLDQQITQQATSGWMEANAGQVIYNGGSEIKIPKISMQGMGNYDRDNGYVQGSVTYAYETKTMTQDRGRTFQLDAMDVNETNFGASAANVMSEFQRTKVIPEIDAYRYSSIAAQAVAASKSETYTLDEADILKKLYSHIITLTDLGVDMSQIVISISWKAYNILINNDTIAKKLDVVQFGQGGVNIMIKALDGIPLIPVSSNRMKTAFTFYDGKTSGQEAGGFIAAAGSKDVHWIITARNAPIAVSKTDNMRIFDPETNQKANAWKLDYRKYHDLWIPDNKKDALFVAVGA